MTLAACGGNTTSNDEVSTDVDGSTPATAVETATTDASDSEPVEELEVVEDVVVIDEAEDVGPVSGGTLRYALEADVDGLNPAASALTASGLNMANAVFDTLMAIDVDGVAVPYLAESVEPVDGDLALWRMQLRSGITFHDGTPFDAEAVKMNFDAQLASPLVGMAVRPFFPEADAATVVDELTVEFRTLEPNAVFPATLTSQLGMMASPSWLVAAKADPTLNQQPVGTGAFVFESRSEDSFTRFVRNDSWWGGEVHLDAIEFLPVPDPSARNDLAFTGNVEMLHSVDPASVGDLSAEAELQSVLDENGEENLVMMNASAPPFDDLRVRQALTLATPLQNVRDLIGVGVARPADQMFIPESRYYNPDVKQAGDDPARAVELAAEYCADVPDNCSDGKINIQFRFPGGSVASSREADILDEGWSDAFNVEFIELAQDALVLEVAFGRYQVVTWRSFGGLEPLESRHNLLCRTVSEGISLNFARFCSEARDALILEAQASPDIDERTLLWQQVSEDVRDAYTYVFTRHSPWLIAFGPDVRGVCDRTSPEGVALRCVANGRTWFDSTWLSQ